MRKTSRVVVNGGSTITGSRSNSSTHGNGLDLVLGDNMETRRTSRFFVWLLLLTRKERSLSFNGE